MTRRVIKPQPARNAALLKFVYGMPCFSDKTVGNKPYIDGDTLWVRETWQYLPDSVALDGGGFVYKASENGDAWATTESWTWRPSIFMPKEAARIFLRVTDVRVERLQEISGADITREGIGNGEFFDTLPDRAAFRKLWDSLRKPANLKQYGWDANPWVWVISFERCDKP